jgi:hypothetical protein
MMRVQITGIPKTRENLEKVQANIKRGLQGAIHATALAVQTTAQKKIQRGSRSGVTYYRMPGDKYLTIRADSQDGPPVAFVGGGGSHNLSRTHKASAPGEPPKTDTGGLASSVAIVLGTSDARVGTGLVYGRYLEFGTTRMDPRPWLHVSLLENQETLRKLLARLPAEATKDLK